MSSTSNIAPQPAVEAAGPWTQSLWDAGAQTAAEIQDSRFVRALLDLSLIHI